MSLLRAALPASPAALRGHARLRPAARVPMTRAASQPISPADKSAPDAEAKHHFFKDLLKVKLSPVESKVVGSMLRSLGIDSPAKLRGMLAKTSALQALFLSGDIAFNFVGALACYLTYGALAFNSPDLATWFRVPGTVLAAFSCGWFVFTLISDVILLLVTLATSLRVGLSADSFIELALAPKPGDTSVFVTKNPLDGVRRVFGAMNASSSLDGMMRALQRGSDGGLGPRGGDSASSLRAFFLLSDAEAAGFQPEAFGMTEREAAQVAQAFDLVDLNSDGAIDSGELRALMGRLRAEPVEEAEAREALSAIDANKDGLVSFDEFAVWWRDVREQSSPPAGKSIPVEESKDASGKTESTDAKQPAQ